MPPTIILFILMKKGYEALNLHLKENKYSNLFIIDSNTNEFCLPKFLPYRNRFDHRNIEFENGEENKNIETCVQIWNVLTELGADRKPCNQSWRWRSLI
jgi:3-dehydroquinate synthase